MQFSASSYFFDLAILAGVFLPIYYLLHADTRRGLLVFACLIGIFYIAPRLFIFYIPFWLVVASLATAMQKLRAQIIQRGLLVISILTGVAILLAYKLEPSKFWLFWNHGLGMKLHQIWPDLGAVDVLRDILLAVGLSFAIFRAIDLLVKIYIGKLSDVRFRDVIFYGFFPPTFISGPIIEYEEVRKPTYDRISPAILMAAIAMFAVGLLKIFGTSLVLADFASLAGLQDLPWPLRWVVILVHPWYFYLNFSGYSDLAIALALAWGYKLKPNFNYPFFQTSPQAFWANWHMSLTRWAQRNIFVPLGGYRKERQYLAITCTMLVIAFWHDVTFGLLVFGLYHATALMIQRWYTQKHPLTADDDLPWRKRVGLTAMTFIFVAFSFPLLEMPLDEAGLLYLSLLWP